MTTWTTEDRVLCEIEKLRNEIRELQDREVKNLKEMAIAMAEIQALRHQLITLTNSQH